MSLFLESLLNVCSYLVRATWRYDAGVPLERPCVRVSFSGRMVFGIFCSFVLEKVGGLETIFGRDFSLTSRGRLVAYTFALALSLRCTDH